MRTDGLLSDAPDIFLPFKRVTTSMPTVKLYASEVVLIV